jgi:predicted component of type VI protein secretion system
MPGELRFDVRLGRAARRRRSDGEHPAMRILLLADFTGRTGTPAPSPDRAPTRVDVDNFDALLRRWAPRIVLPADADTEPPTPLEFRDLEAFHPDALLQQLQAVVTLRELRGRLLDAGTSAAAVAELQRVAATPATPVGVPAAPEPDSTTLERLLGRSGAPASAGPATAVDALVRRLVAPHILPAVDPQASHFVTAVDEALASHLRRVLHHPAFQALESAWRGAHWVVSNLETSDDLQLHLLDITKEELATTLAPTGGAVEDSALYRLLTGAGADRAHLSRVRSSRHRLLRLRQPDVRIGCGVSDHRRRPGRG